jgi:HK97 family phage prohead protease
MENEEKRTYDMTVECRQANEDNEGSPARITGHAAVFNEFADIFGFRERILPGAFARAIKRDDVRALFNHDSNIVLGRNKAKTLRMEEDEKGLAIEVDLPDTQLIRDMVMTPINRGDVSQMSFAFRTIVDEWRYFDDKPDERDIKEVLLYDVSPVTYPAYEGTDVAKASRSKFMAEHRVAPARSTKILLRKLNLKIKEVTV